MIHEISMPALSSTMETGKIVSWLKSPGDRIEKGDNILVVESDKADMDVESFHAGILATIVVQEGESAPVGSAIAFLAETEAEIEQAKSKAQSVATASGNGSSARSTTAAPQPAATPAPITRPQPQMVPSATAVVTSDRILASPLAKRRAVELGVDLKSLRGSGPNGRIVEVDVERAAASRSAATAPGIAAPAQTAPTPAPAQAPTAVPLGETVALSTLQQAVVRAMNASLSVPTFHVGYTITTTALDDLYKQVKPRGVTMTALLAKAVATVLESHPLLNACYSDQGIHYKADINIAVAVAMEDGGLITPVLQKANQVDLYELSRQWKELVERARRKQLQPIEYSSGSFTISNLGMFGVDRFDAILPPNQGSILAVGASRPTVVATPEAAIAVRNQMQVNITCDHRVIYGAHAAAFLQDLARMIEGEVGALTVG